MGKQRWLLPFLLASAHLRMRLTCTHKHGGWPMWCLPCFSSFALMQKCCLPPYGVSAVSAKFPVLALVLPVFLECKGEWPSVFSASHVFCATALLFRFCLSLFPGFWHKPLREIVGSGNKLKPYNLLYLKVPLSSEANSLSFDSVYEPLLLFSPRIPFVSRQIYALWVHSPALQGAEYVWNWAVLGLWG